MEDGTLSEGFVVADAGDSIAAGIQGILVVMDGGDCTPADKSYEVSSKDADGNMTYTSAQNAIANAQPGETIYITNPVTFTEDATIPEGVTVDVASGAIITAEKELDIAGKLINNGTVTVTGGDLTVTGEVDNNGTFSITSAGEGATDKNEATITGEFVGALTATDGINAAQFTNDDGENTYTNVADAMAAIAEMDVPTGLTVNGKVTEASDITLVEGMTLTVNGELVIDSIKLVFGSNLTVGDKGALTTDVIAAVGTPETTGALTDATVAVNKVSGVTNWTVSYNASKDEYSMEMPAYKSGDAVIETGSVNYKDANASFGAVTGSAPVVYKTMKVASGATLVVTGNVTDDASKKYFVNEGTIIVSDNKNFTNVLLGGTVNVDLGKTLTLTASQIVGEVVLATEEGKTPASVAISGQVLIGSTPKTLGAAGSIVGKVTFATANDYVVVFEGSTFNNTDDSVKTLSTAYTI
ncbi:MAG: hypothetical protein IJV90_05395, partial [Candidatus Methanomethylophilaceae archaeon]|nr:hypothetical protein [Candidatus Methanomethylophilaceae archaeon]